MGVSRNPHFKPFNEKDSRKGHKSRQMNLTLDEKAAIAEYLRTGKKSAAIRATNYKYTEKNIGPRANAFFKRPKIINALEKALKNAKFDDQYAIKTLKDIIDAGMENKDIARPDTSLKALETYFKITNKIGGGKVSIKMDIESQAKKMDVTQLKQGLKELDKKQKRILALLGRSEEGELVDG